MAAVEGIGDLQQSDQPGHPVPVDAGKPGERLVRQFRRTPLVKTTEAGQGGHLVGPEPSQPPVLDQVGGMTVVALHAHVLADVVEEGRQLEQLPIGAVESVERRGAVEELTGQAG